MKPPNIIRYFISKNILLLVALLLGACSQESESLNPHEEIFVHEEFELYKSYLSEKHNLPITALSGNGNSLVESINSNSVGIYYWSNTIDVIPSPDPHLLVITEEQAYYYKFLFSEKFEIVRWKVSSARAKSAGIIIFLSNDGEEIVVDTNSYGA
ncbi:MAG: hypothetical protein KTR18_14640 [Acidiferrobacterales bacterium]|nr:hypothetical protein [Acidiferrobacterales bacterium]